jgi:peptidoglycan/xylan/chitin deacetylase (PgdA/CDA1 family)
MPVLAGVWLAIGAPLSRFTSAGLIDVSAPSDRRRTRCDSLVMSQTVPRLHIRTALLCSALSACSVNPTPVGDTPTTGVTPPSPVATTPPVGQPPRRPPSTEPLPPPTAAPATTAPAGPPAVVVSRGNPGRRIVALTFDAGADTGFTAEILDVLDRSGVPATFGITGKWAAANPDLVRRMAGAGHVIMNHTYEHRSYTGVSARPALLSPEERRTDLERTDEVIQSVTGRSTRPWFRAPYGDYDTSVNAMAGALGYRYNVHWTVDSLGWQGLPAAAIATRCLDQTVPGAILLFHVGSASQDAVALPAIIAGLRDGGYGFGTVADLISE